jgi:hypothetical protein
MFSSKNEKCSETWYLTESLHQTANHCKHVDGDGLMSHFGNNSCKNYLNMKK